tara:strand:+ start:2034 stop:2708 length:675 start_codon:yes stop_codon:yes gene_type:complete
MKVSEYIDYLVSGDCSKLAISDVGDMSLNPGVAPTAAQVLNQAKFLDYVNLANSALHKRFNLLVKELELDNPVDGEEYALPSTFLAPISAYYALDSDPVTIKDMYTNIIDGVDTAVSILMPEPFKIEIKGTDSKARSLIILKYAAAPTKATAASTQLSVNEVYTEAMLHYAAFKAHGAISGDMKDENNTYYLRYESSCRQIVTSGMWNNNEIEYNSKLEDNGFV